MATLDLSGSKGIMNNLLEEFTRRAQMLVSEPGILEKRPAWPSVKAGATSLTPFAENAVNELKSEHGHFNQLLSR